MNVSFRIASLVVVALTSGLSTPNALADACEEAMAQAELTIPSMMSSIGLGGLADQHCEIILKPGSKTIDGITYITNGASYECSSDGREKSYTGFLSLLEYGNGGDQAVEAVRQKISKALASVKGPCNDGIERDAKGSPKLKVGQIEFGKSSPESVAVGSGGPFIRSGDGGYSGGGASGGGCVGTRKVISTYDNSVYEVNDCAETE